MDVTSKAMIKRHSSSWWARITTVRSQKFTNWFGIVFLPSSQSWRNGGKKLTGLKSRNDLVNFSSRWKVRLIQSERFGENRVMNSGIWKVSKLCWWVFGSWECAQCSMRGLQDRITSRIKCWTNRVQHRFAQDARWVQDRFRPIVEQQFRSVQKRKLQIALLTHDRKLRVSVLVELQPVSNLRCTAPHASGVTRGGVVGSAATRGHQDAECDVSNWYNEIRFCCGNTPWGSRQYDYCSGQLLERDKNTAGRKCELHQLDLSPWFDVSRKVRLLTAHTCAWGSLYITKVTLCVGDLPVWKSINTKRHDVFAGTPTSAYLSQKQQVTDNGHRKIIVILDVVVAFSHAGLQEARSCCCWSRLITARGKPLVSDRSCFAMKFSWKLVGTQWRWSHMCITAPGSLGDDDDASVCVHVDDFTVESRIDAVQEATTIVELKVDINVISIIGPGQGTDAKIVQRVLSWSPAGFTWEANPDHARDFFALAGVAQSRAGAPSPGTIATTMAMRNALDVLPWKRAKAVSSAGGTATHLAMDRSDVAYSIRRANQDIAKPKVQTEARLKRVARYRLGEPELTWTFPYQEMPTKSVVRTDTNWTGQNIEFQLCFREIWSTRRWCCVFKTRRDFVERPRVQVLRNDSKWSIRYTHEEHLQRFASGCDCAVGNWFNKSMRHLSTPGCGPT